MECITCLGDILTACWPSFSGFVPINQGASIDMLGEEDDPLIWYKDLEKHFCGEFSFAAIQANRVMEDHSQVETGNSSTFVGVYDGHGGHTVAKYVLDHLFDHLINLTRENGTVSEEVISNAFSATEDGFLAIVRQFYSENKKIATCGSCCLVGVIWERTLYIANLGDSRAVLGCVGQKMHGCLCRRSETITAKQLTEDHNASRKEIRKELHKAHPDNPEIVSQVSNVWRVKGIMQVSRAIGDAYLKSPEFPAHESDRHLRLFEPLLRPALRADPSICTKILQPSDKFLIFASDGLWDQLSNREAVEIVYNNPREGIARRLLRSALQKAAAKAERSYDALKRFGRGRRRWYHDDITVVVIFVDYETLENNVPVPERSFRSFTDNIAASKFNILQGNDANPDSVQ